MAKALIGYLGGPDPVVAAEIARLRVRVRDLEDEVARLHATNEALSAVVAGEQMLSVADVADVTSREPALT
jgi:hypothetical protein